MNKIKDSIRLKYYITQGWSEIIRNCKAEAQTYFDYRMDLMLFHDILKSERVVIPAQLRTNIIEKIHAGHQGKKKGVNTGPENPSFG